MKKVLILTVTAGNGHNSAAKSIRKRLQSATEDYDIEVVDTLHIFGGRVEYKAMKDGYSMMMSKAPKFYEKGFRMSKGMVGYNKTHGFHHLAALLCLTKLYRRINAFKPDVIYCTHFVPAVAISDLRLVYKVPATVIMSELDYYNTPFFEAATGVDYFTLSDQSMIWENLKNGFKKEQMIVTGIPVDPKFSGPIEKSAAREKLGLDQDLFTVLVMFGGGEWSGIVGLYENLIRTAKQKMQIIVINGRNKESFDTIAAMQCPDHIKLVNVGFVDNVYDYMFASDVAVTKAGGLSTTEMIAAGLPLIIYDKVYAQEKENLRFLLTKGFAVVFSKPSELADRIEDVRANYDAYRKNLQECKQNATEEIYSLIANAPAAVYDQTYIDSINYKTVKYKVKLALEKVLLDQINRSLNDE